ncbi:hypothetical protein AJ80_04272 [Polytolypa hystricis UAMH7299]|uniref:Uncharacterized protein n=1 Tax=Polytolypa hystricis (strain UAMH7299) TaxID=1447883 RepID=A0A2B7YCF4_POLH7|nr:hypothetical protein AJ80_04272 [Polytolypa hystricis UAMH7299]
MSGTGDDRWRGGRGYDHHRQSGPRGGGFRDRQMGGHQQDRHGNNRGQGAHMNSAGSWSQPPMGPPQEQHVPVRGFNTAEAKDALKKGYQAATSGGISYYLPNLPSFRRSSLFNTDTGPPAIVYKPVAKDSNSVRPSGPWGSKPNSMINGKDFFLELRKQIAALQNGGNVAGG